MSYDYDAAFANTPKNGEPGVGPILLTAACSLTGGATPGLTPTNTSRIGKAGTMGALLSGLVFTPLGQVLVDGVCYLFTSMDNGATKRLIASQRIITQSPGSSVAPVAVVFPYSEGNARRMEAGEELYVGCSVAATTGILVDASRSDLLAI